MARRKSTDASSRTPPPAPLRPVTQARRGTSAGTATAQRRLTAVDGGSNLLASEWLITNGLGGFAMGTAAAVPARRYHGLLIAATRPPVGRLMALNAVVEQATLNAGSPHERTVDLSGFRFANLRDRVHPDGPSRIASFSLDRDACWDLEPSEDVRIARAIHVHPAENAVSISYSIRCGPGLRVENGGGRVRFTVRPLVSLRDFHGLLRRDWAGEFRIDQQTPRSIAVERGGATVLLTADAAEFRADPQWWNDFWYSADAARGQDCVEDLFSPGFFGWTLEPGCEAAELVIRSSVGAADSPSRERIEQDNSQRDAQTARLRQHAAKSERTGRISAESARWLDALVRASEAFVVTRRDSRGEGVSIIAGYPWFSDWGRDTFISLPGLLLSTGRFDEARQTLRVFAAHRKSGLIPNVFSEYSGEPEYNTVDGSLWFVQAACAFAESSGDHECWQTDLAPACLDVLEHYRKGIRGEFNIAMDPIDKLISAGTSATQLTWMDARRDGVTFTPRYGKAVEINALWISGLRRVAALLSKDDPQTAANLSDLADAASRSFRKSFWNESLGCCFDCLVPSDSGAGPAGWRPDASVRPNQVFAASLPHSPLSPEQARAVVRIVRECLWTPRGVRTLDPADPRYRGRFEGDLFQRDGAYHQGTAWPWLLGPLAEATLRAGGFTDEARRAARDVLAPMLSTLTDPMPEPGACLGQIAEVYDGDAPQRPQGCVAQAWSVAEALRVLQMIESVSEAPAHR